MTQRDGAIDDLVAAALLAAACIAGWLWAGDWLLIAAASASAALLYPFALLAGLPGGFQATPLTPLLFEPAREAVELWQSLPPEEMPERAGEICAAGGRVAALPIALFCLRAAFAAARYRPDAAFRTRHDLDSLIGAQSESWPSALRPAAIDPSSDADPDPDAGRGAYGGGEPALSELLQAFPASRARTRPLARALRPEEWLAARGLVDDGSIASAAVEAALAGQLTRKWSGAAALAGHERAFAACIGLFAVDGEEPPLIAALETALAGSRRPGGAAEAMRSDPALARRVEDAIERSAATLDEIARGHWWTETALIAIWSRGREGGGVLAPARFLWLKPEDRTLWYAVQSHGGNPPVEAAGARAHYLAELQYGFPCPAPHVRLAARALLHSYLDREPARRDARARRESARPRPLADSMPARAES